MKTNPPWHAVGLVSFIVWGAWFLAFVVLELLGAFDGMPWRTLSDMAWTLELWWPAKVIIVAGLFILLLHMALRWP